MKKHALIVGARHVGKSTLIRRVLKELGKPVFGFETKKEDHLEEEEFGSPIYIYDAGKERVQTRENLVGWCKEKHFTTLPGGFERYAEKLSAPIPEGSVVLLDEVGFMEASSEPFCRAIFDLLDGDVPVIAAVKDKSIPFLDAVRAHPNAQCFFIDEQNRDALALEVLEFFKTRKA